MIQINVLSSEPIVELSIPNEIVDIDVLGQVITTGDFEHYTGSYEVYSKAQSQTLETEDKVLDEDLVILPNVIYQVETPNTSGWSLTIR